jgi:hypothetical protein
MHGAAGRLVAALTAVMPRARRAWGRALLAELHYAVSRRDQARLVLGAARVALLPPPGLARYGQAAGRAALTAAALSGPLVTGLYVSNVVFPHRQDDTLGVLAGDAYVIFILMAAGAAARRSAAGTGPRIVAGLAAGIITGGLIMATFAVIDTAFPADASHPDALAATAPGVIIMLVVAGAVLAPLGAALARGGIRDAGDA